MRITKHDENLLILYRTLGLTSTRVIQGMPQIPPSDWHDQYSRIDASYQGGYMQEKTLMGLLR